LALPTSLRAATPDATSKPVTPTLDSLAAASAAQITAFFTSTDYTSRHRSDAEFIDDVYRGILLRPPDPKGLADWLAALKNSPDNSKARANVVATFLKSPEYLGKPAKPAP